MLNTSHKKDKTFFNLLVDNITEYLYNNDDKHKLNINKYTWQKRIKI